MALTCIIIDDERSAIDVLCDYSSKVPDLEVLGEFRSPAEAISFLNETKVDLLFLDINMPEISGLQLPEIIVNPPLIIYTTAYAQYAAESYEKRAVDYLLKPIAFDRFLTAVNKASELKGFRSDHEGGGSASSSNLLFIKSGNKKHRVSIEDILFLEKNGHYVVFHTTEKKILSRLSMSEASDILSADNFVQVHRSFIVAMDKVDLIESQNIMIGKVVIPIGQTYKNEFTRQLRKRKSLGG